MNDFYYNGLPAGYNDYSRFQQGSPSEFSGAGSFFYSFNLFTRPFASMIRKRKRTK